MADQAAKEQGPGPGLGPGPGPGPGQGDVPAETGLTVKFSTPPTNDSTKPTHSIEPLPALHPRPSLNERTATESSLPPHHRESIINIPVTPSIELRSYSPEYSRHTEATGSYFSEQPHDEVVASPDPLDDNMAANPPEAVDSASMSGHDILRRMSKSSRGRQESLSDIRTTYPSLHLSGNVISATFNMPHSLKYRKGADWVSALLDRGHPHMTNHQEFFG